jgi:hypothetical protein
LEVVRLNDRGAAKEGKRRLEHARKPDWQQRLHPISIRFFQQREGIALGLSQDNLAMT